jgi:ubiquinone/menaquinone biosynthesis C-methylase UbiE
MPKTPYAKMADIYDDLYSFKKYRKEADRVTALIRRYGRSGDFKLLDVACGTGLHLERLARTFEVEGLDLDPAMLKAARQRLPGVPFHKADFRHFQLGRQFDAVTCLFSSIGYARTIAQLNRALLAMGRHLKPGGVLVLEPWIDPLKFEHGRVSALTAEGKNRTIVRVTRGLKKGRISRLEFHYTIATKDGVKYFRDNHELALFTDGEYRAAMIGANLKVRTHPAGFMGRGLYVATKRWK